MIRGKTIYFIGLLCGLTAEPAFGVKQASSGGPRPLAATVRVQAPDPGSTINLKVTCDASLSLKECARLTKPAVVWIKSGGRWFSVPFTPAPGTGKDLTVTLNGTALEGGMSVKVTYNGGEESNTEPVVPAAADIMCCSYKLTDTQTVQAIIAIDADVYLEANAADGNSRMIRVKGRKSSDSEVFDIPSGSDLEPGDTVLILRISMGCESS